MRLRLFDVPIHVRWSFWVVAFVVFPLPLRLALRPRGFVFVLAWLGVVFVSVLVHELGHAVTARRAGAAGVSVVLYFLGGFTRWRGEGVGPLRRAWVAASGTLGGFVLAAAAWLTLRSGAIPDFPAVVPFALDNLVTVNLVWGALNWIPIRPLDGGHMLANTLTAALGRRGETVADVAFPLVTIGGIAWSVDAGALPLALFGGVVLVMEVVRRFVDEPDARPDPAG